MSLNTQYESIDEVYQDFYKMDTRDQTFVLNYIYDASRVEAAPAPVLRLVPPPRLRLDLI
jgi:hypothetical protein